MKNLVKAGARLLDNTRNDWYLTIDTKKLDLADCNRCILGQIFGSFVTGLKVLQVDPCKGGYPEEAVGDYLGFNAVTFGEDDPLWDELAELWIAEIEQRRRAQ